MNKAIFFDRDGVLNEAIIKENRPYAPLKISDVKIVNGIKELIFELKNLNYLILAVTNQPDYSRGLVKKENIEEINSYIISELNLDDLFCCFHDNNDDCECRKPKPGAINYLKNKYNINLKESFFIGDRAKDIEAAKAVSCPSIFVDYRYNEDKPVGQIASTRNIGDILKIILDFNKHEKK